MRRLFVGLVCVLCGVGVQMVHSASLTSMPSQAETVFLSKHLTWLLLAACCGLTASRITPALLQQLARPALIGLVLLLALVLVPGIGTRVNGAQRWLRCGDLSLQPSELGRLILPIVAVTILTDLRRTGFRVRSVLCTILPLVLVLPLVAREPDLGATVFLGVGYVIALFIGGWPLKYFMVSFAVLVPAAASLFILKPYQIHRITGFIAAWKDLSQAPWQVRQSLLSMGAGGLHGTGVGGGWQKLSYLPEANTDFVFAVIGEELGLAGTLTLTIVWIGVLLTGQAALRHLRKDSFAWILGSTLVIQLVLQALANVAVVTAMVPPKGVPHPFISYGGTNLLVNLVAVGIVVAMARASEDAVDSQGPLPATDLPDTVPSRD